MKKLIITIFLIMYIFTISGCKSNNYHYNIEDDIGNTMDSTISQIFDNTSYIILVNDSNHEEITIDDINEIDNMLQIIKNSKEKISKESNWVGTTLHLNFYNADDSLISVVDIFFTSGEDYSYIHVNITNKDFDFFGVYYINTIKIEKWLKNYITWTE